MSAYLKRLKELRLTKRISQKEIAEYLGITVAAYSLYERGNREPKIAILGTVLPLSLPSTLMVADLPKKK